MLCMHRLKYDIVGLTLSNFSMHRTRCADDDTAALSLFSARRICSREKSKKQVESHSRVACSREKNMAPKARFH